MIDYTYNLNEEIARWATEIYIKQHQELGWWIAFTNPTAGPWKKIIAPSDHGTIVEIYRFNREEERPDLILINDNLKLILITEAKDYVSKLITTNQMVKSIRVIDEITKILQSSTNRHWRDRKNYKIIASFLWMCEDKRKILEENGLVQEALDKNNYLKINNTPLNIVISRDHNDNLVNSFIYKNKEYKDLNTPFRNI